MLARKLRAAMRLLRCPLRQLSVALVGAATMSRLHRRYLGRRSVTDVLSFELEADESGVVEGEVVVCLDVARREARRRGHAVESELLLYALHGVLHLCGYEDETEAAYRRMHAREDRLLRELGMGAVFSRPPMPPARPSRVGSRLRETRPAPKVTVRRAR